MSRRNNKTRIVIDAAINRIASDNTSGAAEILRNAGTVFALDHARAPEQNPGSLELTLQAILETCTALARAQPEMTPLLKLASAALSAARNATGARQARKSAEDAALSFIANAERAAHDAALRAATLIRDGATVLTHSRSSTVLEAFIEAKRAGRSFSVVATESRPMLEGRALAEAIARHAIPVSLIADAAASLAMDRVNLVLVGADRITPVDLVNKIGTRMIALSAHERSLPLYALCDSSKFIRENYLSSASSNQRSVDELWNGAPDGVTVVNRYFEPTALSAFTGIINEDGVLSPREAARRAEKASIDEALAEALGVSSDRVK